MTASSTVQHAAEQLERREARRGDKLGRTFLSARRAKPDVELWAQLEKKIKNRTPWRDRWVWVKPHRDRQLDGELEDMRAQVAGDFLLELAAKGELTDTQGWFKLAAAQDHCVEAWLFDPEMLRRDGWEQSATKDETWYKP